MHANPVCSGHRKKQQKIEFSRILYVTDDDKFSVKGPKKCQPRREKFKRSCVLQFCERNKLKITPLACKLKKSFAKKCLLPLFKNESVLPNFPPLLPNCC